LRIRVSIFQTRLKISVGFRVVPAPVPADTNSNPYPRPLGWVSASTRIFRTRCHPCPQVKFFFLFCFFLSLPVPISLIGQIKARSRGVRERGKERKRKASPRLLLGLRPASHLTSPPSAQASGKRSKRAWQRYGNGTRVPSISHTLLPTIPFRIEWVIHRSSSYCSLLCLACDATPLARTSRVCVALRAAAAWR